MCFQQFWSAVGKTALQSKDNQIKLLNLNEITQEADTVKSSDFPMSYFILPSSLSISSVDSNLQGRQRLRVFCWIHSAGYQ